MLRPALVALPLLVGCSSAEGVWVGEADVNMYRVPIPHAFELEVVRDERVKRPGELLVLGTVEANGKVHEVEGIGPWRRQRVDTILEPVHAPGQVTAAVAFELELDMRGGELRGLVSVRNNVQIFEEPLTLERVE